MRIISTVIVILLLSAVPTRAAGDDAYVTPMPGNFHALSRIPEEAGVALVPLTDDELAYTTQARPRNAPATSPVRSRPVPDTSGVSRPIDAPSPQWSRAAEDSGIKVESAGETARTRARLLVEEEPDPGAVIDWLLKEHGRFPRLLEMRIR
jgi:hypothetical protein